ncbi:RnfH family protein [Dyella sp. M7H15-1]|uniref:RnfH family protein n=1 Tax=Dyella sp. M7H15-1 TaxID=2501295 RepID=UPI00100526F6|nr:RnfH family protein [Dyella sp. M7H15-1]QAU23336.1 RnfH family protein [Dyella sp. M7H15-1]
MDKPVAVEVVWATAERQILRRLSLPAGSTVIQAVEQSGILQELSEVELDPSRLGIFSRRTAPEHVLQDGDRVEIYRPLTLDPKDARRRRMR